MISLIGKTETEKKGSENMGASSFPRPVQSVLDNLSIIVPGISLATAGSTVYSVDNMTQDHVVAQWRFFDSNDSGISDGDPPADITVVTTSGAVTVTVANIKTANCYMSPLFLLPVSKTPSTQT